MNDPSPAPSRVQAEVLIAGVLVIAGAVFFRDAARSAPAHYGEIMAIARDAAAAALTLAAALAALLIARSVTRREGRHCQPPAPAVPRPARVQYPGQPAYSYTLRPPAGDQAAPPVDVLTGGDR